MAKIDKLKEELGWLKVIFTIAIATNLSLIGYLIKNYQTQSLYLNIANIFGIIFMTISIYLINKQAYKKIDEIGEL